MLQLFGLISPVSSYSLTKPSFDFLETCCGLLSFVSSSSDSLSVSENIRCSSAVSYVSLLPSVSPSEYSDSSSLSSSVERGAAREC